MRAARGEWPLDAPKVQRNQAIVQARKQGLSPTEVARMFGVSPSRVQQIWKRAAWVERFQKERAESGGRARLRTLGGDRATDRRYYREAPLLKVRAPNSEAELVLSIAADGLDLRVQRNGQAAQ